MEILNSKLALALYLNWQFIVQLISHLPLHCQDQSTLPFFWLVDFAFLIIILYKILVWWNLISN